MGKKQPGFDVREVLVPVEEVADIRVTNGNTGTVFMVGTQEEKEPDSGSLRGAGHTA